MKEIIKTPNAPQPIGPYNQAVLANNTLYVAGQIAIDPVNGSLVSGDTASETSRVMDNIKAIVVGLSMNDIIKASIFVTDISTFKKVNEIYGTYFEGSFPAREVVGVSTLPLNAGIMISVIAVKPD